ncbi:MAG TPA: DISARM system helicase DrmA [Pseudonocardiaceae bacterium]|nr:DISARM system helicase DrmA [Pseudonocardiaceae bacterium]
MTEEATLPKPDAQAIRDELHELVLADLLGPLGGPDEEFGDENPIDRYPLGRLAPRDETIDPATHENMGEAQGDDTDDADPEPDAPSVPSLNPSALGFTAAVLGDTDELIVTAKWGRYERMRSELEESAGRRVWKREQRFGMATIRLTDGLLEPVSPDPDYPDVVVRGRARRHRGDWLVSIFLDNQQHAPGPRRADKAPAWLFQVTLSATGPDGRSVFVPRTEPGPGAADEDEDQAERRQLAMTHRNHPEFAVGSGTAVRAEDIDLTLRRARLISTSSVPQYEVPFTDVPSPKLDDDVPELELTMKRLADLADGPSADLIAALRPLVDSYRAWIERQAERIDDPAAGLAGYHTEAKAALGAAGTAADRIAAGIDVLAGDPVARQAFGFANRAMYLQRKHTQVAALRRQRRELSLADAETEIDAQEVQAWRPFQLAFVLLNLPSLADPRHPERAEDRRQAVADLLWFPTGGGKTEAYLGLTAFAIAVRRRQPRYGGLDARDGVAVLMRYTLRLLTIQQFERAATLICAAEKLRREDVETWGEKPIRVGLWVGQRVTPNTFDQAQEWSKQVRRGQFPRGTGSPHQLSSCPWCGAAIERGRDIDPDPTHRRTLIICADPLCPFSAMAAQLENLDRERWGLPVLVVDEEIYRHPPSLLIGTVDKFAQLPWRGETATLFGQVDRRCGRHGYVTDDILADNQWERQNHNAAGDAPAAWIAPADRLRPPDLIIQDELHLISGPLGSLVGLYEAAVDKLASWTDTETARTVRPKVVASTATVRRANRQIGDLFYRRNAVFPPPGLDIEDNFFARQRPTDSTPDSTPGRRYVGICAHGVRIRSTLIRVYVSVLGAAQRLHVKYGRNEITDPYMTLVGYFNSLRDLAGMRRMVEDDVTNRLYRAAERGLARRRISPPTELTSRLGSEAIRPLLDRLSVPFPRQNGRGATEPIDVLLATNMIAVGVDVSRLGLMVVANQPKSTAEYIQATSRVGRSKPGIVFTVYNWARPRDLSHYERFEYVHATLYRQVEALSVTPFADRAVDRGLTGVLVSLVRESELAYNGNHGVRDFSGTSRTADHAVGYLQRRAGGPADRDVRQRVADELRLRLDMWDRERAEPGRRLVYAQPANATDEVGLLRRPGRTRWDSRTCPMSLRDVEPSVPLLLLRPGDRGTDAEPGYQPVVPDDSGASGTNADGVT